MDSRKRRIARSWLAMSIAAAAPDGVLAADEVAVDPRAPRAAVVGRAPAAGAEQAERLAGDYVAAFNAGESAVAAFYAGRGVDGLRERTAALSRRYAPLDVHAVAHTGDGVLALLARSLRSGEWVYLTLISSPSEPGRLLLDRVDPEAVGGPDLPAR